MLSLTTTIKKILLPFCCMIFFIGKIHAGTVDTVLINSTSMHKIIKAVVIKPNSYNQKKKIFPVVYLLHGYGGTYSNWIIRVPALKNYADDNQTIIVCPDGNIGSWYFDSPIDSNYRYETHITVELIQFIDSHYRTIADKKGRAITGLSMGGHGALYLALKHPNIFGAAGSISGGVDLGQSKSKFEIMQRIGDTITNAANWHDMTVINLIEQYTNTSVKIIFDCGNKDIFIEGNRHLHQKMNSLGIPHSYTERPGEHNWDYWKNSIPYQLLYFKRFFYPEK